MGGSPVPRNIRIAEIIVHVTQEGTTMPALQEAPPKACPKCRGTVIVERDWHGTYGSCIMCGYVHEVLTSPPVDLAAEEAALPLRQRRRQPSHGKLRL